MMAVLRQSEGGSSWKPTSGVFLLLFLALLAARGVHTYYVKTLDDPGNRAIAFYEREGFERIGTRIEAGRRFVEFHKRLDQR